MFLKNTGDVIMFILSNRCKEENNLIPRTNFLNEFCLTYATTLPQQFTSVPVADTLFNVIIVRR